VLGLRSSLIMVWAAVALSASAVYDLAQAQSGVTIRLATQELPPYQTVLFDRDSNTPELTGLAVDRVTCALAQMQINYEITLTDWSAAQLGTQTDVYDGFFVGSANASRARYSTPSVPIISEDLAWYMPLNSNVDPNDLADALGARYSAKFATSKWRHLMTNGYNVVMRPQNAASLLNMLLAGDIDVALEYELIFQHYMEERGISEDQFIKIPFRTQTMSVHFSNKFLNSHPSFQSRFDTSVQSCAADQE
jgi:polar amino acid transport system substrate-binding protein